MNFTFPLDAPKTIEDSTNIVGAYWLENEGSVPYLCPYVQTNSEAFLVNTRNAFLKGNLARA
jgi:hypothetical protein